MSVPTIASLTPAEGPSVGQTDVEIVGSGFRPATLPPSGQFSGGFVPPTAVVLFGGVPALDVRVFSGALLSAIPPPHAPGAVDVQIQNLDQATGLPIAGETVTAAGAYTYALPLHTAEYESDLTRIVRTLIRALKAYLVVEITDAVHTDYDEETGDELHVTKFAKLPGITIIGPDLSENRFYSMNAEPTFDDAASLDMDGNPTAFVRTRVPYTVDLLFRLIGVSNSKIELLNLVSNFVQFMHRTKFLPMSKSTTDHSLGVVAYEFDFAPDGQPKTGRIRSVEENGSNLRVFEAQVLVRGFDIETMFGVPDGTTAGVPNAAVVERGYTAAGAPSLDPPVQGG